MSALITSGEWETTPVAVALYYSESESGNVFTDVPGRASGEPDVALRPASLRRGILTLVYGSEADSADSESTHRGARTFTIVAAAAPTVGMVYATDGRIRRQKDDSGAWVLEVGFRELLP